MVISYLLAGLAIGAACTIVVSWIFMTNWKRHQRSLLEGQYRESLLRLENDFNQKLLQAQADLEREKAVFQTELHALAQSKLEITESAEKMEKRFESLAAKIFEEKTKNFTEKNVTDLSVILNPFKERLKEFEKKVEDSYSTERSERGSLRGELTKLLDLNQRMSREAENLSRALKGDVKQQGTWGEMLLESILEKSGLRKDEEYTIQGIDMGLRNDEGQVIKPDVIINLPEQKHIIVDSKVSLTAYEGYVQSEDPVEQERFAKLHVESLKRHIDGLSAKKYYSAEKLISPDFVILFMPLEPAFALAFKFKPDLLQYAWDRNIAMVSPTTLLTTLRTVAIIWKQERQERNALEIAKRGGQLYDKFVALVEELSEMGSKIESAQKAHTTVMNRLSQGNGNLIRQVEMLKELGAKTEKSLPAPRDS